MTRQSAALSAGAHALAYVACAAGTTVARQRRAYSSAHTMPLSTASSLSASKIAAQLERHAVRSFSRTVVSTRDSHVAVDDEKKLAGSPARQCAAEK